METRLVEALVRRAQGGDIAAFERLIQVHVPLIRRFARAFTATLADADDLAQDALVRAFRSLRAFRVESSFATWLYAIVHNVYVDYTRSKAGRGRAAESPLDGSLSEVEALADPDMSRADRSIEREELRQYVWKAVAAVPDEYRLTLVLYDIEGLTYEEIAAVQHSPVGTVKSRLSRGREHLRRLLTRAATDDALSVRRDAVTRTSTRSPAPRRLRALSPDIIAPKMNGPRLR